MTRIVSRGWAWLALVMALAVPVNAIAQPVHIMYGLVKGTNELIRFNALTPGTIEETIHLTGMLPDETLKAIDFRPLDGQLYAIAADDTSHQPRVYHINLETGVATPRARTLPGTNMDADWGMSFSNDRPRIVSSLGQNMRVGFETGGIVTFDTDLNAAQPPPPIVDAIAVDRQFTTPTTATIYAINRATNSLATLGGINGQSGGGSGGIIIDVGPLGVAIGNSSTSLEITSNGAMFAAMRPNGGSQSLYTINAQTGAATLVGVIGTGVPQLDGLAVVDPTLRISPGTGKFVSTQVFDFALIVNLLGRSIVTGEAFIDGGVDATPALAACAIPGTAANGVQTFRCKNVVMGQFLPGLHFMIVELVLSDGAKIRSEVFWDVIANTEP